MSLTTRAAIGLRTTLLSDYAPGDGVMHLAAGSDGIWAGATSDAPGYLLAEHPHCIGVRAVYSCTGSSAEVLSGVAAIEGMDQFFPAGSALWLCTLGSGSPTPTPTYNAPAFTAFAITGQAATVEVGTSVGNGGDSSLTFTWATSNSGNVAANSISIADTTGGTTLASSLANDGTEAVFLDPIVNDAPASNVFTVGGTNTHAGTFGRTFTIAWKWRVWAGTSANATLTANQIKALSDSASLQSGFAATYALSSGGFKYICYPDSMGSVASFVDPNTGFPISMATADDDAAYSNTANGWSYALVSVTNAQSVATNYRVYRSQFTLGGAISMRVT